MDNMVWIWLIGTIIFVVLEAVTYQIVSIWFALGAVGALIAKAAGATFAMQMAIFIGVSVLCLVCLRPVSRKLIKNKTVNTNVDSLLGRQVLITKEVNNLQGTGEGKVGGMVWTVRSADDTVIGEGETAVCERVEGVKLIVKRKGE